MTMGKLIEDVNSGKCLYKFARNGASFSGLRKQSFTPKELKSPAFGFVKNKGSESFTKVR